MTRGRRALALGTCLALAAGALGCSHDMRILNLHAYSARASLERSIRISLEDGGADHDERLLVSFVRESLSRHPAVERVVLVGEEPRGWDPHLVARIEPRTEYEGSLANFLITFPGFLLFTHAWNGYQYRAHVETDLVLSTPDGRELDRRALPTDFELRHCSTTRGFLSSSGWWTPFFGAINIIIGGFMVGYDHRATEPFLEDVRRGYGDYLSNHVIEMAGANLPARMAETPEPAPAGTPPDPEPSETPPVGL